MGLYQITKSFFPNLLTRLGIPTIPDVWSVENVVRPVSIVDQDISVSCVTTTQILNLAYTQGVILSVGAGVLLADTGQLLGGNYNALIMVGIDSGVAAGGGPFTLDRRNAANSANVWTQMMSLFNMGTNPLIFNLAFFANPGERLRLISTTAWTVGANAQASIFLSPPQ